MDDDFPRRRRRRVFDSFFDDDFFGGFEDEFRRMSEHMNSLFDEASRSDPEGVKKYVYGFTMRTGPDGKPVVEEFGNVPRTRGQEIPGEREPLVDVIDGKEEVTVIAELPGVDKKDINLDAGIDNLTVDVDTENRKYRKQLQLPAEIDPDEIKATYKNGILEVKLKRKKKQQEPKKKIHID